LYRLCADLPNTATQGDRHYTSAELDEELPIQLVTALAGSRTDLSMQPLKVRQKGLRLAVEFMEEYGQENPSIPEICRTTGLSWRSLDRAFREYFGVGPKRYMMNFRLTNVRRTLMKQPPGAAIFEAANGWGFWHMGDFAREYRRMFCELPSETLRQRYQ
jgi:transcriptional regulator GlxA family with amidase domain